MAVTLDQIVAATRQRLAATKPIANRAELSRRAAAHNPRGFAAALRRVSPKVRRSLPN